MTKLKLRDIFGRLLHDQRMEQLLTLEAVGKRAGISKSYVWDVEQGNKDVSSELLSALCVALNYPLRELLIEAARELETV